MLILINDNNTDVQEFCLTKIKNLKKQKKKKKKK